MFSGNYIFYNSLLDTTIHVKHSYNRSDRKFPKEGIEIIFFGNKYHIEVNGKRTYKENEIIY
jgi:4-hydroxy-3-methylbut-2-enyl diphosphate reductase IspH